jgi:hypothetical protein
LLQSLLIFLFQAGALLHLQKQRVGLFVVVAQRAIRLLLVDGDIEVTAW